MRTSEGALALIRRPGPDGQTLWLVRWNETWGAFHLVGGHREGSESFRASLVREIGEELGLPEGVGCDVAADPLARFDYTAMSRRASVETRYIAELYEVKLPGSVEASIASRLEVRWVRPDEVRRGSCDDGRPVSPTANFLLMKAGLV